MNLGEFKHCTAQVASNAEYLRCVSPQKFVSAYDTCAANRERHVHMTKKMSRPPWSRNTSLKGQKMLDENVAVELIAQLQGSTLQREDST